jgi:hypothetical protein
MEDFKVTVVITTEKGTRHEGLIKTQGKPGPRTIARSVKDTLHKGWDATLDETKVIIRGFKGSPVKSVRVEVIGLDAKYTPRVTRLAP